VGVYSKNKLELKSNLSEILSVTCKSVILPQLNLTKRKLEFLNSDFKRKKKDKNTDNFLFTSLEFDFFKFSSNLPLEYGRKCTLQRKINL